MTATMPYLSSCYGLDKQVSMILRTKIILFVTPGGRGESKALGRVLLEQKVERQSCIRKALNGLFLVKNPFSE